jgi:hypothetical protein
MWVVRCIHPGRRHCNKNSEKRRGPSSSPSALTGTQAISPPLHVLNRQQPGLMDRIASTCRAVVQPYLLQRPPGLRNWPEGKPISGFALFYDGIQSQLKARNPGKGSKELTRMARALWRDLLKSRKRVSSDLEMTGSNRTAC